MGVLLLHERERSSEAQLASDVEARCMRLAPAHQFISARRIAAASSVPATSTVSTTVRRAVATASDVAATVGAATTAVAGLRRTSTVAAASAGVAGLRSGGLGGTATEAVDLDTTQQSNKVTTQATVQMGCATGWARSAVCRCHRGMISLMD